MIKMFGLGFLIGFITGVVFLAVASCIFVENDENNKHKW